MIIVTFILGSLKMLEIEANAEWWHFQFSKRVFMSILFFGGDLLITVLHSFGVVFTMLQESTGHVSRGSGENPIDHYAYSLLASETGHYALHSLEFALDDADVLAFTELANLLRHHYCIVIYEATDDLKTPDLVVGDYQRSFLDASANVGVFVVETQEGKVVVVVYEGLDHVLRAVSKEDVGDARGLNDLLLAAHLFLSHDGGHKSYDAVRSHEVVCSTFASISGAKGIPMRFVFSIRRWRKCIKGGHPCM